jgi:recombinational DNA repair ATPase RecF
MRLLRLEIENVRGIRSLVLTPAGKNLVIWGPNGSGKSAVVDAIDFLFTGRVSRLSGKGSAGLSLASHGPHVSAAADAATVTAVVEIPSVDHPFSIRRCIAHPSTLECPEDVRASLMPILGVAQRGQHVLSRREILKFITAEAGTRAEEIQALLDLSEVEEIRKSLVRVRNDSDRDLEASEKAIKAERAAVGVTLEQPSVDPEVVLSTANRQRAVLGGAPLGRAESSLLKAGLSLPQVASGDQTVNVTVLDKDFAKLAGLLGEGERSLIAAKDAELRALLATMRGDPERLEALSRLHLLETGIPLIGETGACPLCDAPWPPGDLSRKLKERLETAHTSLGESRRISALAEGILGEITLALSSLDRITAALGAAALSQPLPTFAQWSERLSAMKNALTRPLEGYPDERFPELLVGRLAAPEDGLGDLEAARAALRSRYPEASPEQTAWDTLTRLEENLRGLEHAESAHRRASLAATRAHAIHDEFVAARDSVLGELYDSIAERFTQLYRGLHGTDESEFTAAIRPEGAALQIEVGFYGHGTHPPHALHSEGHQDSMGLCLYLALAERLTLGLIDLTILDDVVMSVDANHRRQICSLLAKEFADRQFVVTTHDKTWAHQLRREGVVAAAGSVEFYNWSLATGPHVNLEAGMWAKIEEALQRGDVPDAAATLRRGSEEYFAFACDALEAQVKYRLDGRNDLGDYLPSAICRFRSLLKQAKVAARSWNSTAQIEELETFESIAGPVFQRSNAEQWAINAAVHFNTWENMTREDFEPVVEAFVDLHALFACQACQSPVWLAREGYAPVALRCNCDTVHWNLVERP